MEHQNLLYYSDATELEEAQGTGGTVTTVRPGVAYEHAMRGVRYNKKKTTYFVTVNYKRINGTTISESEEVETGLVMPGKTTKLKLNAIEIEGYKPVSESVKLLVSADTSYDFLYKMYTAYTVTVNYIDASGETIACATTITTDDVAEGDYVMVSITPESISGYKYTGETPIIIWVSGDTEYDIEYEEGATYETVDLGLPSGKLWAAWNVGAESPEEYGDYYAFGEIVPKTSFTIDNYAWYDTGTSTYTKYNGADNKTQLDPEDDVVAVSYGGNWHMPSSCEYQELLDNTTSAFTTLNGVSGLRLTSIINGNTIFFPYAGETNWSTGLIDYTGEGFTSHIRNFDGSYEDSCGGFFCWGGPHCEPSNLLPGWVGLCIRGVNGALDECDDNSGGGLGPLTPIDPGGGGEAK